MQFMPATFAAMGVDGDGDGRADIRNDADSVYLRRELPHRVRRHQRPGRGASALFAYNHADWYVNDVLYYAHALRRRHRPRRPDRMRRPAAGRRRRNPHLPPLTNDRVAAAAAAGPGARPATPTSWARTVPTRGTAPRSPRPRTPGSASACPAPPARNAAGSPPGNGFRVQPGTERPGDLIFWDSYLGPSRIGHVMLVWDPATRTTIEARSRPLGVGHFSYAAGAEPPHLRDLARRQHGRPADRQ